MLTMSVGPILRKAWREHGVLSADAAMEAYIAVVEVLLPVRFRFSLKFGHPVPVNIDVARMWLMLMSINVEHLLSTQR